MADSISVLVVDEDPEVLTLTQTFLERESDRIEATTEQDAETARDRLLDGEFDCVVSDYKMPAMSGLDLFEAVKDERPELPFFVLSAAADQETAQQIRQQGVTGFVRKGVGTEHYTDLATRILDAVE